MVEPSRRTLSTFGKLAAVLWLISSVWETAKYHFFSGGVLLVVAIGAYVLACANPALLRLPFIGLALASLPIEWVVSGLALLVVFFCVITPTAVVFRIFGRDALRRKRRRTGSYWLPRTQRTDLRSYLRQF